MAVSAMSKTILITGATDGIGLATARMLVAQGHQVIVHGRSPEKLEKTRLSLSELAGLANLNAYLADLSDLQQVTALADTITGKHNKLDVLINNAGVFKTDRPLTGDGLDSRFVVNTFAPYLLTKRLLPIIGREGRVINLSSAAQAPVKLQALNGSVHLPEDYNAYAQSKLALTMWSRSLALALKDEGPLVVAVNPGSLLGTKMVREGFGVAGADIKTGAEILVRAALSDEFAKSSGLYFDNDKGQFASPHPDALDTTKLMDLVRVIESTLDSISINP